MKNTEMRSDQTKAEERRKGGENLRTHVIEGRWRAERKGRDLRRIVDGKCEPRLEQICSDQFDEQLAIASRRRYYTEEREERRGKKKASSCVGEKEENS